MRRIRSAKACFRCSDAVIVAVIFLWQQYVSPLFLMNRIRFAMAPDNPAAEKLMGTVECDESYIGGRPRIHGGARSRYGTKKTPVFAAVERQGRIRRQVLADMSGKTLKGAIHELVDGQSRIMTDNFRSYKGIGREFSGGHGIIAHSTNEYVRGGIRTSTAESSFALLKHGITGIYHSVSWEYLHRYLWQFGFLWNLREMNDGERTIAAIKLAEGKRLMYKQLLGRYHTDYDDSGVAIYPVD
jgi:transposase-like protein